MAAHWDALLKSRASRWLRGASFDHLDIDDIPHVAYCALGTGALGLSFHLIKAWVALKDILVPFANGR